MAAKACALCWRDAPAGRTPLFKDIRWFFVGVMGGVLDRLILDVALLVFDRLNDASEDRPNGMGVARIFEIFEEMSAYFFRWIGTNCECASSLSLPGESHPCIRECRLRSFPPHFVHSQLFRRTRKDDLVVAL